VLRYPFALKVALAAAFVVVGVLYAIWSYRHDSHFRNDVKRALFAVTAPGHNRKLLLLGDSRIEFLQCAHRLDGWAALNLGVSGMTSDRLAEFVASRKNALTSFDAIALWIGGNDILRGRPAADVSRDILSILQKLGRSTTPVALFEQIPILNGAGDAKINQYNADLVKLSFMIANASDRPRISILEPFANIPIDAKSPLYSDSLHLSDQGNKVLCHTLGKWLATL
jgi:lysophospholipase L1-like esterase